MHPNHYHRTMNERGIALVMVLVLALIGLAIVSALIFMVTQGTTMSGAMRFYRSAEEASVGTAEILTDYFENRGVLNILGAPYASGCNCGNPSNATDNCDLNLDPTCSTAAMRSCRCDKLCNFTADWPIAGVNTGTFRPSCDDNTGIALLQVNLDPRNNPDLGDDANPITFGVAPNQYRVYVKIVDTVRGNTDVGTLVTPGELGGKGVTEEGGKTFSSSPAPYLYRTEVLAENTTNPRENSRMSVLYSY